MRNEREFAVDVAVLRVASVLPKANLHPEGIVFDGVALKLRPKPFFGEFIESLRHLETEGLMLRMDGPRGNIWKITDAGRAWLIEHA